MRKFFTLTLVFLALPCLSQQLWSLDSCMSYAIDNGYSVERARRNLAIARNNYTVSIGAHLPSLSASVNVGSGFGRGIDPATNTYQNTTSFNNSYGIGVGLPIFRAFALVNSTLRSKIAVGMARSEIQKAMDELSISVMESWADAAFKAEIASLTKRRVDVYQIELRRAQRRSELGQVSAADVAQIASALAAEESSLVERENAYDLAVLELKRRMNFPITDTLQIFYEVSDTLGTSISATDLRQFRSAGDLTYLPHAEILGARLKMEKYSLRISRSSYYPSISASAGASTNYYTMLSGQTTDKRNFAEQIASNMGQSIGVNMSIPIFSGLSTRSSVRNAKIRYDQAQSDYDESMRALRTQIKAIWMEVEAATKRLEQARRSVHAANLAYRAIVGRYDQGMASVIELQTVYNQLFSAEADLMSASLTLEIKSRAASYFEGESLIR